MGRGQTCLGFLLSERFFQRMADDILDKLMSQLHQRVSDLPEGSYTTKLVRGGIPKIAEKILEEAHEVIEAAGEPEEAGKLHTIRESADVLYHLWVLLATRGITVDDIRNELLRREGVSGLEEKRNRREVSS
jgi:phosphoribosyl-ATP pyrophosphohydrolase